MVAWPEQPPGIAGSHAGADRHAGCEPLGQRHHIGPGARVLPAVPLAGAPHATLHLVAHHQPALVVADGAQFTLELRVRHIDATLALNHLEQDGNHVAIVLRDAAHGFNILVRHTDEALHQGLEAGLGLAVAGCRQGRHGAAVKRALHDDDVRQLHALVVAVHARELDRGLVGLTARVAEEHLVHTGGLRDTVGELLLQRNAIEVGGVDELARLFGNGLDQSRVSVAQRIDRDT